MRTILLILGLLILSDGADAQFEVEFDPQRVRLKDLGEIQTLQEVQLLGYGLVVGLEGVGDGRGAPFTIQSLANLMRNMGVEVDAAQIRANNTAAAMVTATIGPTARVGSRLDVTVSSIGDAGSLEGGVLLMTPLQADPPNGPIVAIAQGPLSIGGFNAEGGGGAVRKNHPVVGRIPNGAIFLELVEIIQLEVGAFEALLKTLTQEQVALVKQNVHAIEEAVTTQQTLVERARALETARIQVIERLAGPTDTSPESVTLRQLIDRIEDPQAQKLRELREQLLTLQEDIRRVNQHNSALVKQSMKYVDKTLNILTGEGPATGVYGQSGKVASKSTSRAVVNHVA